jgi:hypothetical protein
VPKAFIDAGLHVEVKPSADKKGETQSAAPSPPSSFPSAFSPVEAVFGAVDQSPSELVQSVVTKKGKKVTPLVTAPEVVSAPPTPSPPQTRYEITDEALELLVKSYSRESGVRSLEKVIEKVARKLAYRRVTQDEISPVIIAPLAANSPLPSASDVALTKTGKVRKNAKAVAKSVAVDAPVTVPQQAQPDVFRVTVDNLAEFAGKPTFLQETIYDSQGDGPLPVGVVMGLAWDPMGWVL